MGNPSLCCVIHGLSCKSVRGVFLSSFRSYERAKTRKDATHCTSGRLPIPPRVRRETLVSVSRSHPETTSNTEGILSREGKRRIVISIGGAWCDVADFCRVTLLA